MQEEDQCGYSQQGAWERGRRLRAMEEPRVHWSVPKWCPQSKVSKLDADVTSVQHEYQRDMMGRSRRGWALGKDHQPAAFWQEVRGAVKDRK